MILERYQIDVTSPESVATVAAKIDAALKPTGWRGSALYRVDPAIALPPASQAPAVPSASAPSASKLEA